MISKIPLHVDNVFELAAVRILLRQIFRHGNRHMPDSLRCQVLLQAHLCGFKHLRSVFAVRGTPVDPEVVKTRYLPFNLPPMLRLSAMNCSTCSSVSSLSQTQPFQFAIKVFLSVGGRSDRSKDSGTSR